MVRDPFHLKGKTVLITGGSRGIGRGIAECVANAGGFPIITYRSNRSLAENLVRSLGIGASYPYDANSIDAANTLMKQIRDDFGAIDGLVNNAGILEQKPIENIDAAEWDVMLGVNLRAPFLLIKAAIAQYRDVDKKSFSVVNMSSVGGLLGGPKAPHYSASKGGLNTLTRSCARLYGPEGVRVNAIAPGFIRTDMFIGVLAENPESTVVDQVPLGYIGEPQDVGLCAVYLLSDAARYITGQVINISGGYLI